MLAKAVGQIAGGVGCAAVIASKLAPTVFRGDYEILRSTQNSLWERGPTALRTPGDLARHTLLQVSGVTRGDWSAWLSAAGQPKKRAEGSRLTFDLAMMAVQATVDGLGVCIGRSTYVEEDLRAGRLVAPFDLRLKSDLGFYLVTPHELADSPKVQAFRSWLMDSVDSGAET